MDITDYPDLGKGLQRRAAPTYPTSMAQEGVVNALIDTLSTTSMKSNLQTFVAYNNR